MSTGAAEVVRRSSGLDRHTKVTLSSAAPAASSAPSSASARGLDWFTFFLADIQTGFGPFVAIKQLTRLVFRAQPLPRAASSPKNRSARHRAALSPS
jgi:isocitrate lyase